VVEINDLFIGTYTLTNFTHYRFPVTVMTV